MQVEVRYRPAYALAVVTLDDKEKIQVEGGAMVAMSPGLEMQTEAKGGFMHSLSRSVLGGETFFLNTYTAKKQGDSIALAPTLPGDISIIEMKGETLLVQSGSYLASSEGIEVETKWSGSKGFFGSHGLIMLRLSGHGTLIVSSYGAIHPMSLEEGQTYVVDTGNLVSFGEEMPFEVKKVSGWKSTLFSGEGLVVELSGPGDYMLQTRSQDSFIAWIIAHTPSNSS